MACLLSYSIQQSPTWIASRFSASHDIPRILWNLNVHYGIHRCPQPVPVLSQLDPVHNPLSYFLYINLNIILPYTCGSPKWSFSIRFPHQNPVYDSPLHPTRYLPHPSHSSRFYQTDNIGWAVQIIKLLIMQFPPLPCYLVRLGLNILLSTLFWNTLSLHFSLNISDQVSHPYKTTGKIIILYILIFKFFW